jgi:hypothetical protein
VSSQVCTIVAVYSHITRTAMGISGVCSAHSYGSSSHFLSPPRRQQERRVRGCRACRINCNTAVPMVGRHPCEEGSNNNGVLGLFVTQDAESTSFSRRYGVSLISSRNGMMQEPGVQVVVWLDRLTRFSRPGSGCECQFRTWGAATELN